MNQSLVMTVIGPDRPGILAKMAETIDGHGGSWLESRLARFAGHVAGVLRFDCHDNEHDELLEALHLLEKVENIEIKVVREVEVPERVTKKLSFNILGNHRPGFMNQIATAIHKVGGNIEEHSSECDRCPQAGHILCRAMGTVAVVDEFEESALVEALEAIGSDLIVSVSPVEEQLVAQPA